MAGMAMLKGKYKYMPLSEANVSPVMVSAYDGQHVYVTSGASSLAASSSLSSSSSAVASSTADAKPEIRYTMGNYLGGGIAGIVYEAYDNQQQRQVAIKILNPVGYKLCTPSALRRAEIVKKGVPSSPRGLTMENVFWVKLPNKRDLVACYVDARMLPVNSGGGGSASTSSANAAATMVNVTPQMLRELTLEMCVALWRLDGEEDDDEHELAPHDMMEHGEEMKESSSRLHDDEELEEDDEMMLADREWRRRPREEEVKVGDVVYKIPAMPAKYKAFLESRKTIYREIAHMHKLTGNSISGPIGGGHANVLKLYDVLELVQPSKSTIFLVLELAAGGELFDRIRAENGVDDAIARTYFTQLLSGVLFCHQLGIVHRDLKPENLLLSDTDVLKIADFGLSAHFIAAVSSGGSTGVEESSSPPTGGFQFPEMDEDEDLSSLMIPAARFRRLNSIVGSPHYVAPEILQNARYGYDGRKADMWSIGVILYSLLVGSLPFGKDLQTCARYLKFCEWIRSLPCDVQTGKLVFDTSVYNAGPVRIPSSTSSVTKPSNMDDEDERCSNSRFALVHPNSQPTPSMAMMMNSSSAGMWSFSGMSPAPSKVDAVHPSNDSWSLNNVSAGFLPNGAPAGRRGSRVVTFPSWLFPEKLAPSAVFLLASLLHPEPGKRVSCEDACRSAWVAGISL
ncbi:hypothetical protein Poli38472_011256 [Pythium oligandrum]|uniref:non-specific serine/threonine protein kinase n=1 Tax=Pythium oligandrum TaxID=41045 RepID=A0A8K1FLY2_PYTOL|nr:hypothetical protein Poli38472_011256 [Pythium oligandrum]|eukprot:TMW67636.1 hypothetical protein Poli38472_011256 [Pythium oligandrum]